MQAIRNRLSLVENGSGILPRWKPENRVFHPKTEKSVPFRQKKKAARVENPCGLNH
jgi:hypothetical protein